MTSHTHAPPFDLRNSNVLRLHTMQAIVFLFNGPTWEILKWLLSAWEMFLIPIPAFTYNVMTQHHHQQLQIVKLILLIALQHDTATISSSSTASVFLFWVTSRVIMSRTASEGHWGFVSAQLLSVIRWFIICDYATTYSTLFLSDFKANIHHRWSSEMFWSIYSVGVPVNPSLSCRHNMTERDRVWTSAHLGSPCCKPIWTKLKAAFKNLYILHLIFFIYARFWLFYTEKTWCLNVRRQCYKLDFYYGKWWKNSECLIDVYHNIQLPKTPGASESIRNNNDHNGNSVTARRVMDAEDKDVSICFCTNSKQWGGNDWKLYLRSQ